jgi:hypothetical protein
MKTSTLKTSTPEDPGPVVGMGCREASEILPWLVNGSLEESEQGLLSQHLAACESCRLELAETVSAWGMLTQHVPSLALAEYAQGLEVSALDRERMERHFALCPSCRQELALAMPAAEVELAPTRSRRGARSRRQTLGSRGRTARRRLLAVAASVILTLLAGTMAWSFVDEGASRAPAMAIEMEAFVENREENRPEASDPGVPHDTAVISVNGFESGEAVWSQNKL